MNTAAMQTIILTLFPEMFPGTLGYSLAGKALERGIWSLETMQIRDFATDKHKTVDDKSYGGGTGLVMKADVVGAAIDAAKIKLPNAKLIYLTPRGMPLTQELAYALTNITPTAYDTRSDTPTVYGGGKGGASTTAANIPPPFIPPRKRWG